MEDPARRMQVLRQQIHDFQPDWVLVSSEDLGHGLLREAHHSAAGRVVYLAHTPQFLSLRPGQLGIPTGTPPDLVAQSRRRGRHRPPHGGVHRAATRAAGGGDPSADLRRRAVRQLRTISTAA